MKTNTTTRFEDSMANAPRIALAPKSVRSRTERDLAMMLLLGLFLGAMLMLAAWKLIDNGRNPLDLNRDGKVTLTDLLLAKRTELRIKAEILGLPDPFSITSTGEVTP